MCSHETCLGKTEIWFDHMICIFCEYMECKNWIKLSLYFGIERKKMNHDNTLIKTSKLLNTNN